MPHEELGVSVLKLLEKDHFIMDKTPPSSFYIKLNKTILVSNKTKSIKHEEISTLQKLY